MSGTDSSSTPTSESAPSTERRYERVWPVYNGGSFNLWDPDTGDYYDSVHADEIIEHLRSRDSTAQEDLACRAPRIAFRDVTRANDTRTFRCALIPGGRVAVNTAPFLHRIRGSASDEAYLLGMLSSMVCDWQARRTVELHMTFGVLGDLSVPDPGHGHPVRQRMAAAAGRLAAADERFADWATEVGVECGPMPSDERDRLLVEVDACAALLYGLDDDEVRIIYDTFAVPSRWGGRRDSVIATMSELRRTQRRARRTVPRSPETDRGAP